MCCVVFVGVLPSHLPCIWTGLRVSIPQAAQAQNVDEGYRCLHAGHMMALGERCPKAFSRTITTEHFNLVSFEKVAQKSLLPGLFLVNF